MSALNEGQAKFFGNKGIKIPGLHTDNDPIWSPQAEPFRGRQQGFLRRFFGRPIQTLFGPSQMSTNPADFGTGTPGLKTEYTMGPDGLPKATYSGGGTAAMHPSIKKYFEEMEAFRKGMGLKPSATDGAEATDAESKTPGHLYFVGRPPMEIA